MADTTVKYYTSAMLGAPVLTGTAGALADLLHACLVTGFGLKMLDSLTTADGVATGTVSAGGLAFEIGSVVRVAGATPSGLNGDQRVTACTATTVKFAAPGIEDGSASGTITVQQAPAGWTREFSATNKAVFRGSIESTGMYLRVDDSSATYTRVVGYETMSDVDTGTGPFPTNAQINGGGYWPKADAANATARAWELIGDDRSFLLKVHTVSVSQGISGSLWSFGDISSLMPGDTYGCVLHCSGNPLISNAITLHRDALEHITNNSAGINANSYTPRDAALRGASTGCWHRSVSWGVDVSEYASGVAAVLGAPNAPLAASGAFLTSRKSIVDPALGVRGFIRGLYLLPHEARSALEARKVIAGSGELAGRRLMALAVGASSGTTAQGRVLVDVTGPWR